MDERCTYQVEVKGKYMYSELNASSPIEITIVKEKKAFTCFSIHTDQSGLIGFLRFIHTRGLTIQSVQIE